MVQLISFYEIFEVHSMFDFYKRCGTILQPSSSSWPVPPTQKLTIVALSEESFALVENFHLKDTQRQRKVAYSTMTTEYCALCEPTRDIMDAHQVQ